MQSAVAVAGRDTETAARDSGHGATVIKEVKILVVPRGVDGAPKNGRNRAGLPSKHCERVSECPKEAVTFGLLV